jgi:hypothetical protein
MGFTLRSFLLAEGIRAVTTRKDPPTVSPSGIPAAIAPGRPDRPRFLGFCPSESPWRSNKGLTRRPLDAPLGFALLGYSGKGLDRGFTRSPLSRFSSPAINRRVRRRPRVSIDLCSASSAAPYLSTGNGQSDPSRVPAPTQSRAFERAPYRAMFSPHTVPDIAARPPVIFGRISSLYRSCPGSA